MVTILLVCSVFVLGVGAVMGAYGAVAKLPGFLLQRKLNTRLEEVTAPDEPEATDHAALVKERHAGPLPGLDRFASGTARGSALAYWIEQSGASASVRCC